MGFIHIYLGLYGGGGAAPPTAGLQARVEALDVFIPRVAGEVFRPAIAAGAFVISTEQLPCVNRH